MGRTEDNQHRSRPVQPSFQHGRQKWSKGKESSMSIIRGIIPVAPTIFTDSEELDLGGQRRVVDYLVDGKSDAVCILANYSEQFSLTDEERELVVAATLNQASDRLPVCVTTSHFSARIAARRSRQAQERGAAMVMLMAPFFGTTMKVDDDAVIEYFKQVADGLEIDIMVQDAPIDRKSTRLNSS